MLRLAIFVAVLGLLLLRWLLSVGCWWHTGHCGASAWLLRIWRRFVAAGRLACLMCEGAAILGVSRSSQIRLGIGASWLEQDELRAGWSSVRSQRRDLRISRMVARRGQWRLCVISEASVKTRQTSQTSMIPISSPCISQPLAALNLPLKLEEIDREIH